MGGKRVRDGKTGKKREREREIAANKPLTTVRRPVLESVWKMAISVVVFAAGFCEDVATDCSSHDAALV